VIEEHIPYYFNSFTLYFEVCFISQDMVLLEICSNDHLEKVCIMIFCECNVLSMAVGSCWSTELLSSSISLLSSYFYKLLERVLKSLPIFLDFLFFLSLMLVLLKLIFQPC
jgi:hypothetical protein